MESLSAIFERSMEPDESTRPDDGTCVGCGGLVSPVWVPVIGWRVGPECPHCDKRHREEHEQQRDAKAFELELKSLEAAREQARDAIAPTKRTRSMTFGNFIPQTDSQIRALELAQGKDSLWLHGKPGCGKTHLATAIALSVGTDAYLTGGYEYHPGELDWPLSETPKVDRWLVADLMALMRSEAVDGDIEEQVARLSRCDLLVLDDLGVERPTPFVLETLYRIVDARYERELRTIVTSNALPSVVAKTIGARIHSRLVGMCKVVKMDGKDHRLEA